MFPAGAMLAGFGKRGRDLRVVKDGEQRTVGRLRSGKR